MVFISLIILDDCNVCAHYVAIVTVESKDTAPASSNQCGCKLHACPKAEEEHENVVLNPSSSETETKIESSSRSNVLVTCHNKDCRCLIVTEEKADDD